MSSRKKTPKTDLKHEHDELIQRAADAARAKALGEIDASLGSVRERFDREMKSLGAALSMLPLLEDIPENHRALYVQVGEAKAYDGNRFCGQGGHPMELPFTQLCCKYQNVTFSLTAGWGSAVGEIAKAMSSAKDDQLPWGDYRYVIMIYPAVSEDGAGEKKE